MNKTILLIVGIAILTLAVGTATSVSNALIPSAHAKSGKGGGGAGAVPLIPIQTGNKSLDKTIQSFYSCIKKTGHTGGSKPEPSKAEVINCYTKTFNTATTTNTVGGA
jgi:hypothetical protein